MNLHYFSERILINISSKRNQISSPEISSEDLVFPENNNKIPIGALIGKTRRLSGPYFKRHHTLFLNEFMALHSLPAKFLKLDIANIVFPLFNK